MLSVSLVLEETSCASFPGLVGFDCGLGIDNRTHHGARMFIHFVEAPETRVRAGDIGPVLGLQNIKCVALSSRSYSIAPAQTSTQA